MNSMTEVIVPKSDQINADDLIGRDMVITITGVRISPGQEQPVAISFAESTKVFRPCKSMSRVLVAVWGPDANRYVGRSLKLYRDPDVKWGGLADGGIRIREMSDMDGNRPVTLALTEKKGSRKPTIIKPLAVQKAVEKAVERPVAPPVPRINEVLPKIPRPESARSGPRWGEAGHRPVRMRRSWAMESAQEAEPDEVPKNPEPPLRE